MKKLLTYLWNKHAEIYKGMLLVLSITVIVYLFPKQAKFKYDLNGLLGKPWYHENLIAPFNFAIRKSQDELDSERKAAVNSIAPYFQVFDSVKNVREQQYTVDFQNQWMKSSYYSPEDSIGIEHIMALPDHKISLGQKIELKNYNIGKKLLDSVYNKGIIRLNDIIENKPPDFTIYVLHNNVATSRSLKSFYTIQSAYAFMQKSLTGEMLLDKDVLLSVLENAIDQNIVYDKATTRKLIKQASESVSLTRDVILKDQIIISKGEIVNKHKYQVLKSLQAEYESQSRGREGFLIILGGQILIVSICLLVLTFFLGFFRKDIFQDSPKMTFIFLMIVLMVLLASLPGAIGKVSIYLLPFCILPIMIRTFFDTRLALFVHLVTMLIISFLASSRFEFIFLEVIAGMVAIFSIVNMRNRSQIFLSSGLIFVIYSLSYFALTMAQDGGLSSIDWWYFVWFFVSALLTLFAYPLIYIFEKTFGFISDVSLMELSDTNNKLLRELASKAPGTFQHSLQVANLAEEAIYEIGGNAQLVRTGAMYHDIGKMDMPLYFIENQTTGVNPHEELGFEESAAIIISHVIRGIEKAKKHKIPEQIIDFIRTHHGTTATAYFYNMYKKQYPGEEIDKSKFQYPGPIPYSKETAVLMMSDSVEAASRSLKSFDEESISGLVDRIIDGQIEQNQFLNANITFKDITSIKKILKKKLMNIYHVRVEYPR